MQRPKDNDAKNPFLENNGDRHDVLRRHLDEAGVYGKVGRQGNIAYFNRFFLAGALTWDTLADAQDFDSFTVLFQPISCD